MYKNLIVDAKKDGIKNLKISAIVRNRGTILLLENFKRSYELPGTLLKKGETIQQGLQRALMEETGLSLVDVLAYLGHHDEKEMRDFFFVVEVENSLSVNTESHLGYAWVGVCEAVGYPMARPVMETLDLYAKLIS